MTSRRASPGSAATSADIASAVGGLVTTVRAYALLALIGLVVVIRSFITPGERIAGFAWKPLALVLVSTVLLGVLVRTGGLVIALVLLVLVSAWASRNFRWSSAVALAVGLRVLVFVKALGLPIPVLGGVDLLVKKITNLMPTRQDFKRMIAPILRGTALGSALGILPGGGAMLASFASYSLEKKVSKYGHQFGKGAIEGVAGPESANNAGAQTSFVPMLTLGIPSNPVMALMIGALIIQGIQPGPAVMVEQPQLFWGIIVSRCGSATCSSWC